MVDRVSMTLIVRTTRVRLALYFSDRYSVYFRLFLKEELIKLVRDVTSSRGGAAMVETNRRRM